MNWDLTAYHARASKKVLFQELSRELMLSQYTHSDWLVFFDFSSSFTVYVQNYTNM